MENQHQLITGYRDLTRDEINLMNDIKEVERIAAALYRRVHDTAAIDQRWAAIAKTNLQLGFMALVRAVARPQGPEGF